MNNCLKYEKILDAYLLDLLDDDRRKELEIHLLECRQCNQKAQDRSMIFQLAKLDPEVRDTVIEISKKPTTVASSETTIDKIAVSPISRWRKYLPVTAVITIILIMLIANPWHLEFHLGEEAVAQQNLLAIMYFDNIVDPGDEQKASQIISNLLITDLSDSRYFQVMSNQRLFDIKKLLGIDTTRKISRETATQIADQAKAKWMLTGNILQLEPNITLTSQIIEVSTGNIVTSQRISGDEGDDIFAIADKLSARIKSDLPLPDSARAETDKLIADKTTHSVDAYRDYLTGLEYYQQFNFTEASRYFVKALEYDSTFAMAYYYLSRIVTYPYNIEMIKSASMYIDNTAHMEKLLINIQLNFIVEDNILKAKSNLLSLIKLYPNEKYPHYLMAASFSSFISHDEVIYHLNKAIELDPLYKEAYNLLAYTHAYNHDFENAMLALDKYIELAPDEPNPYDSKADILSHFGRLDEAIEYCHITLEKNPEFYPTIRGLADMYLYKRDYSKADSLYYAYSFSRKDSLVEIQYYRACQLISRGQMQEAIRTLEKGVEFAKANQRPGIRWEDGFAGIMEWLKLRISEYSTGPQGLLEMISKESVIKEQYYSLHYKRFHDLWIEYSARSGRFEDAYKLADGRKEYGAARGYLMDRVWGLYGLVEFYKGNYPKALEHFKKYGYRRGDFMYYAKFMLARTYLEMNLLEDAGREFRDLIPNFEQWRIYWVDFQVLAHYYLAVVYEKSGQIDKAVAEYNTFLTIWKDADPDIAQVVDARARLAALNARP